MTVVTPGQPGNVRTSPAPHAVRQYRFFSQMCAVYQYSLKRESSPNYGTGKYGYGHSNKKNVQTTLTGKISVADEKTYSFEQSARVILVWGTRRQQCSLAAPGLHQRVWACQPAPLETRRSRSLHSRLHQLAVAPMSSCGHPARTKETS
jgi:hypothetical protein